MLSSIQWPNSYLPGFTDNFVSNEVIAVDLDIDHLWSILIDAPLWPTFYSNSANVRFHDDRGPELGLGKRFAFETFGFSVEAEVVEFVSPSNAAAARLAWHGWGGNGDGRIDVHHAWLIEKLEQGRLRVLTQETQNGAPAKALAKARPNPMINAHQDWLDGLVAVTRKKASATAPI